MTGWKIGFLSVLAGLALTGPAAAGDIGHQDWIWSDTAPLVNRATEALATGHVARAERLARQALAATLTPVDARIAAHNLCLAKVGTGMTPAEEPACAVAATGPDHPLIRLRGAVRPATRHEQGEPAGTLTGAIAANIALASQRARITTAVADPY